MDAINLKALPLVTLDKVLRLRRRGHRFVYVRMCCRGYLVGTQDLPGWALVLG